jgi:hypothetical protein
VLHVQAPGDPAVPEGLASWFTERAFHFYAASLRLPPAARLSTRAAGSVLRPAFADMDAACTRLRRSEGMASVIITAQGRAAVAAALWSDSHAAAQDALILAAPAWPAGRGLHLNIVCPVLVIAGAHPAGRRAWPRWPRRTDAPMRLGGHVTWLQLAEAGASPRLLPDELGRWLGAYMYGPLRDQLL